ncbi:MULTISPECIES: MmcQ/YjbR family DNA-binding protein [Erwinia]|jgi:predicted DNA-binding protein (MmcQ/YjbR family)|uniref:MmcQ/YjbR family DNA-binding protein n=1 Tax=Erwinia TaxID=551 RepID=UPI0010713D13|nr:MULTISPECIES: MmcQ/YjbR family DNA-binding protein [Erwinia]MBN7122940.1 cytoplasmic protein [Erwinia billingiae]QBR52620.1 MmcQ/YjbR family DNA-binding protein [Erwinia sp. QL-Z3]
MDGKQIHQLAADVARTLPSAELCYPFGPEYEVFKVRGKMFALLAQVRGERIVNLKCDPENALLQRAIYDSIHAAYHMNKRHWISIYPGEQISEGLVRQLVEESYDLVVAGLPKRLRPMEQRER